MESKKINQLATNVAPVSTDLTIIGDPVTGVSKKITLSQIASLFAGAVDFYANLAAFPASGVLNTIYCAKDTQKLYLWSGSAYVEVFPSQALLNTYQLMSEKGVSNGYASLDSLGKVPVSQLPASVMEYKGTWSAATNTPTLANGTGDTGDLYICSSAGSVNFGAGSITFSIGDYVLYSGSIWQRSSGAVGTVTSVGLSSATSGVTIGSSPITTSGTITLAIATATTSQNGLLSSTDWATFNGKESVLTFSSPLVRTTNTISIPAATTSVNGYLASADFTTFNNKQNAITLTTTGTSGASTLVGATLNIPNYGSALTGYVPYTGATQDVDLGAFKLNAQSLHIKGTGGNGHLGLKHQSASATASANEVSLFADSLGDLGWLNGNLYLSKFITSGNTAARSYTFPDATCNIPNDSLVVHLAGTETITGAKTFSGGVTFSSSLTTTSNLTFSNSGFTLVLQPPTLGVNRTVTLPNGTGTLALTSDISYPVTSVFGRTGAVVATEGDYSLTQLSDVTITSPSTGQVLKYNGTAWVNNSDTDTGITSLNGLTALTQTFAVGTSGTDFNISSATSTHTFNIPSASATNRGLVTTGTQTFAGAKTFSVDTTINSLTIGRGGSNIASNTAIGETALYSNTTGTTNTAIGGSALYTNTTGFNNTAISSGSLASNTTGRYNTGVGVLALYGNTTGDNNTALGSQALNNNTTGEHNTAIGVNALETNSTGTYNLALGNYSLGLNTTGTYNIAVGNYALPSITTGTTNIAIGTNAGTSITTGSKNTIVGSFGGAATTSNNVVLADGDGNVRFQWDGTNVLLNGNTAITKSGTITTNYLPKFTGASTIGDSAITDDGTTVTLVSRALSGTSATFSSTGSFGNASLNGAYLVVKGANGVPASSGTTTTAVFRVSSGTGLYNVLDFGTNESSDYSWIQSTRANSLGTYDYLAIQPNGGNLLVGTLTNSTYKLDVNGTGRFTAGTYLATTSSNVIIGGTTSDLTASFKFITIGNSAFQYGGSTGTYLRIEPGAADTEVAFKADARSGSYPPMTFYTSATLRLTIASGGGATFTGSVTATGFFESSDSRLKTLIQDNYQTKGIASITPKLYTKNGKVELGYYAQDFVGILDSAVSKGSDDMLSLSYREVHTAKIYALEQEIKELKAKLN